MVVGFWMENCHSGITPGRASLPQSEPKTIWSIIFTNLRSTFLQPQKNIARFPNNSSYRNSRNEIHGTHYPSHWWSMRQTMEMTDCGNHSPIMDNVDD